MKSKITLVDVSLRDGLQNEKTTLSVVDRYELFEGIAAAGITRIEVGSFVRADKVPQMQGTGQLLEMIKSKKQFSKIQESVLVPNTYGYEQAQKLKPSEIAVFTSVSETFAQKNINCSIAESFARFAPVFAAAKKNKTRVRAYVSCCLGCPFEGKISEKKVLEVAERLYKMGAFEVSIGDTIGIGQIYQVQSLFKKLKKKIPVKKLAGHFHDTRGQALANILASYQLGIQVFDASLGGIGGCPYAPGSSGNVALEEVVYLFEGLGIKTGIDLKKLISLVPVMEEKLGHRLPSRLAHCAF